MAENRAQAYKQKLDSLVREAQTLSPDANRIIAGLLADANREILADVAQYAPDSYTSARLRMLQAEIQRVMQQFGQQAAARIEDLEKQSWEKASLSVSSVVAAGTGSVLVAPVVDKSLLSVVQGYTADLITGLSHDAAARINAAIQRGALGGLKLPQLVEEIGRTLEGGKFSGLFSQVGERAMMIATNETMRVQSLATQTRIDALATRHATLAKRWLHIPVARVPRPAHILASGQIRKPKESFDVAGEALLYPRDPGGSAWNTINCHCLMQPYLDEDTLKPTDQERSLLKSYGISVTTTNT